MTRERLWGRVAVALRMKVPGQWRKTFTFNRNYAEQVLQLITYVNFEYRINASEATIEADAEVIDQLVEELENLFADVAAITEVGV